MSMSLDSATSIQPEKADCVWRHKNIGNYEFDIVIRQFVYKTLLMRIPGWRGGSAVGGNCTKTRSVGQPGIQDSSNG